MPVLLPQFKCHPESFAIHFRTRRTTSFHNRTTSTTTTTSTSNATFRSSSAKRADKTRRLTCLRAQCIVSTTSISPSTSTGTAPNMVEVRLPLLQANSNSVTANRPWTYLSAVDQPVKENLEAILASEMLLTSDEAVIAAASTEAITLAKAALKLAKDAALIVGNSHYTKSGIESPGSSQADALHAKWAQFIETKQVGVEGDFMVDETGLSEIDFMQYSKDDELEIVQEQQSKGIAVRSKRQTERKARRARAGEKASVSTAYMKSESTRRKKKHNPPSQEVDNSDPLRLLRATTNTSRLLTAKEEVELSKGIQDLLKLESLQVKLAERCGCQPTFAQWAAAAGVDQWALRKRLDYGVRCKDKMIKSNIRLVISIAKNYTGAGMSFQDLVQEGCRGLVKGAEKFDASKGFKFSTYAHWWIKQSVRKSLSDLSRTIRLPFHMVEATYRVKEARKQLYNENGRNPYDDEIAEATGLSMKRVADVLLTPKAPRSLEQKIGIYQNLKPSEVTAHPDAETSEDLLIKQYMKQDIATLLENLSQRERQVIRWRYGMEDGRMKTLQEIGEIMGISRERVRQIELCAFRKLKNKKRTKHLVQYLYTT